MRSVSKVVPAVMLASALLLSTRAHAQIVDPIPVGGGHSIHVGASEGQRIPAVAVPWRSVGSARALNHSGHRGHGGEQHQSCCSSLCPL